MTTQVLSIRDEQAERLIRNIILQALPAPAVQNISFAARDSHSGEPALYVHVLMSDESQIPEIDAQIRLSAELLTALQRQGDERFPYLFYGPRKPDAFLEIDAP